MPAPEPPPVASLYEHAPVALLLTDADGAILRANHTACSWLSLSSEQLRAKRFQDLLTIGGRIFHQTHWLPLLRMQGSVSEVKLAMNAGDGRVIPVMVNAVRRETDGSATHEIAFFVAEDRNAYERELMLARRRAEGALQQQLAAQRALSVSDANLRMALEAADLYLWSAEPQTGSRTYEERVATLLGAPADEARFIAAIPAEQRDADAATFGQLCRGERTSAQWEHALIDAAGQRRFMQVSARLIEQDGAPSRIVGMLHDVTQLTAQRAAAEESALLAEQMMGIVSHDLRNPLAAILTGATTLQRLALASPAHDVLQHIVRATRRARRMIDELLDFTAARMGRGIQVSPQPIALHDTVRACVAELQTAYPATQLRHEAIGDGTCVADADRLAQLVGNLVSNAVKYGASAPITIRSQIDGDACTVSVHNEGDPIPADVQPMLFMPMVRGTSADVGSRSLGLGLYIVSEIARAHGGAMVVESKQDSGTRFTLVLPQAA